MMMKQKIVSKGSASIEELRAAFIKAGVNLIACQMKVDLFDFKKPSSLTILSLATQRLF